MITINHSNIATNYLEERNNTTIFKYKEKYGLDCEQYIKIIVTTDIFAERISYSENETERQEIAQIKESFNNLHGHCLMPSNSDSNFYIILPEERYQVFENGDDMRLYQRTIFHELTHAQDFYCYKVQKGINNLRRINEDYAILYFYSEIRAKYRGECGYFIDNILKTDKINIEKNINMFMNVLNGDWNDVLFFLKQQHNLDKGKYYIARFLGDYLYFKKHHNIHINESLLDVIPTGFERFLLDFVDKDYIFNDWNLMKSFYEQITKIIIGI